MVRWAYLIKPREEASGLDPEAVHYDTKAIQERDVNWQPSTVGYLVFGFLLSPQLSALVYTI